MKPPIAESESALTRAWIADKARALRPQDLLYFVYLPVLAAIAWFIPEHWWDAICRRFVIFARRTRRARHMQMAEMVAKIFDGRAGNPDAHLFVPLLSANTHRARVHVLRCYRPPEWQPQIDLIGLDHLERALHAGRGAILWVAPFVFSDLLTKMAIHRAGVRVTHLSRSGHGFSATRLGVRLFNPIWTNIEDRYLAERLVMSPGHSSGALRALVQRVRENKVVSVTVGVQGSRAPAVPFLSGILHLADAVPALAMRTGAALLPVFTVRGSAGTFISTIEPELSVAGGRRADVAQLVAQEVALLESWVLRYPDQYVAWEPVRLSSPAN